jgi:GTP cyclohydrolase I
VKTESEYDLDIEAIRRVIEAVGEDPDREGLRNTPGRVMKALREMTAGYDLDPKDILATKFSEVVDELIIVQGIRVVSMCEHHLLPFVGEAVVGYLPNLWVVGLSKIPRLVEAYARRFQIQERLTQQVADALMDNLQPLGVGVVIRAQHSCMAVRGVRQESAYMTTSALLGYMREKPELRAEFLALAYNAADGGRR